MCEWTADYIEKRILAHGDASRPFVLGLPTGSTPIGVYSRLAARVCDGQLSLRNVISFNMDEYVGLPVDHPCSYHYFMQQELFRHVDLLEHHLPDGNARDLGAECARYEALIAEKGPIDLFLCGVGSDGHLAFNEPFTSLASRTHEQRLNDETVRANARFFDGDAARVPHRALTVGVRTVLDAHEVLVLASGAAKARAVQRMVEGPVSHEWTCSALQMHPEVRLCCDEEAVGELKVKTYRFFQQQQQH